MKKTLITLLSAITFSSFGNHYSSPNIITDTYFPGAFGITSGTNTDKGTIPLDACDSTLSNLVFNAVQPITLTNTINALLPSVTNGVNGINGTNGLNGSAGINGTNGINAPFSSIVTNGMAFSSGVWYSNNTPYVMFAHPKYVVTLNAIAGVAEIQGWSRTVGSTLNLTNDTKSYNSLLALLTITTVKDSMLIEVPPMGSFCVTNINLTGGNTIAPATMTATMTP